MGEYRAFDTDLDTDLLEKGDDPEMGSKHLSLAVGSP
jgi:hypothetical protein